MGADFLEGSLTATVDGTKTLKFDGTSIELPLPKLDWQAGHDFIDTLELNPDEYDLSIDEFGLWSALGDRAEVPISDLMELLEAKDAHTIDVLNRAYRQALHDLLKQTEESLGWRDVDTRILGPIYEFRSGGMSWGDSPTDALDIWWKWTSDVVSISTFDVLKAVGFIEPLGSPGCPFEVVPKNG